MHDPHVDASEQARATDARFIGIQLGSHSVFDEGVEHVLDLLQRTASINALLVYTHTYQQFAGSRPLEAMADHGVPVRDPRNRQLTHAWVPYHEEYYAGTVLRHVRTANEEYGDRDVLEEVIEPARKRDMKVYGRILEGHGPQLAALIPNWPKILTVDIYGRRHHLPCWNKPDYRQWWLSTIEDIVKSYPVDGFMYGAERSGPLPSLLTSGTVPGCFCHHCMEYGRAQGINGDRAREGYEKLYEFVSSCRAGTIDPVDGFFVTFLRILLKYPEILAWEYAWHRSKEGVAKEMYGAVKAIQPAIQVGWHVYHPVTWDPIYRAEMDYSEISTYSDWIKPVVYHDIAGVRIRNRYVEPLSRTIAGDSSPEQVLSAIYSFMGYDSDIEPALDEMATTGMSPEYVYREVRRCVQQSQVPVYAGVGFDVPTDGNPIRSDSERVYQATLRAFQAGAQGLVVSREYDEMRIDNLEAVGRAVRDAAS
jgi:hypothetical protein